MSVVTEAELFAGYRVASGYAAKCECGVWITAASSSSLVQVAEAVRSHNLSSEHVEWSASQEAVNALRRTPVHICKCHDHGGN